VAGIALVGLIALAFSTGAYYATGTFGTFSTGNAILGALALAVAALRAIGRARGAGNAAFRGVVTRGLLGIALVLAAGVLLERIADASRVQWDWSFERRFELSEGSLARLTKLCGRPRATLYADEYDPRARSTRLLLRTMAATDCMSFRELRLEDSAGDEDRFGIGSSNTVVMELGEDFETVARPTEGSLYEALSRLARPHAGVLYIGRGAGEGSLTSSSGSGYSGLREALLTEGFLLRDLVTAATSEIPADADAVLLLAPQRPLRPVTLDALQRHLERGGRLVAFLEPGTESGLEGLLAEWGLTSPNQLVIDPASGPVDGASPGANPLAFHYGSHPISAGLDSSRMTFFPGTRTFVLRKPQPDDRIDTVVFSSGRAWLSDDLGAARRSPAPEQPEGAREDYYPLVVAARFPRGEVEARIVAFGDAELASNQYLRALYNLDLVMNALHWAVDHTSPGTRPKVAAVSGRLQLPLPLQNTLTMFQGVGLLLPELLLIAGAIFWARSRTG
jgi:hypothetical protein